MNRDAGAQTRTVWLALGANLGDRVANLAAGLDALAAGGVEIDDVSAVYDTPPWGAPGGPEQPRFANVSAGGRTALTAHELLALCKRIEAAAGRDFDAPRNSARPLDVDILMIEGEMLSCPDLVVPHPRMHERSVRARSARRDRASALPPGAGHRHLGAADGSGPGRRGAAGGGGVVAGAGASAER